MYRPRERPGVCRIGDVLSASAIPLALLELPPDLTDAELGSGFRLPPEGPALSHRIEDSFLRRIGALPPATQRLLLVAAADPTGDPVLLWRAAGRLGIGPEAAAPAEATGCLTIGQRVTFRHPLARSAAYRAAASPHDLRAAHQALAEATDPEADPERRVWHRARRWPALMSRWQTSSSGGQAALRHVAGRPRPRPSWNARPR
jgi:hypothetical protein